jgi:hypothetical protein
MVKMDFENLIEEANCSETTSMQAMSAETVGTGLVIRFSVNQSEIHKSLTMWIEP